MDVAGLSHERGAPSSATRRSASTRGRRSHAAVRAETTRRGREPVPAVERVAGAPAGAAPDTADQLQADYFVRLLAGRRGLIDQRTDEYQRKIATAEAKGDADAVTNLRRLVRVADQDRETLDVLIDKLRRRFVRPTPAEARPAARRGAPGAR